MRGQDWKWAFLVLVALSMACSYYREKDDGLGPWSTDGSLGLRRISFLEVRTQVFAPHCISCHGTSGGVSLENWATIRSDLARIRRAVFIERRMPPDRRLSEAELQLLAQWMNQGAPEYGDPGPTPEPSLPPLEPKFTSLQARIFSVKCIGCHSPGGSASGVSLDRQSLLDSPRDLVLPGNPDESGLWLAVSRTDGRRMPPPESGAPLPAEEIDTIRDWIRLGAPE